MIALIAAALIGQASAAPITFQVCDNPTFRRNDDAIEVRCPGKAEPALRVVGCVKPRVTRVDQQYTLTCESWKPYTLIPAALSRPRREPQHLGTDPPHLLGRLAQLQRVREREPERPLQAVVADRHDLDVRDVRVILERGDAQDVHSITPRDNCRGAETILSTSDRASRQSLPLRPCRRAA